MNGEVYILKDFPFRKNLFFAGAGKNLETGEVSRLYTEIKPGNHIWILGATGCGKTVHMTLFDVQALLNDMAVIKADLKFSYENFYTLYVLSHVLKKNFYVISPVIGSHSWNPFIRGSTVSKIQKILDLLTDVGGRREAYYEEVKRSLVSSFVEALDSTGLRWSLKDIYACLLDTRVLRRLINISRNRDSTMLLKDLNDRLESDNNYVRSQAMKEISALKHVLSFFCHDVWDRMLNSYVSDIDIRCVVERGDVVYFVVPGLVYREVSGYISRLFISEVIEVTGELIVEGASRHGIRYLISIDEFQNFLVKRVELLYSQSRAAGAIVMAAHQSVFDIDLVATKELRNVLATNTKLKFFFRLPDVESVNIALSLAGKEMQSRVQIENFSFSTTEYYVIDVKTMTTLPTFHFFSILEDSFWLGHTYIINDLSCFVGKQIPDLKVSPTYNRSGGVCLWEYYLTLNR